MKSCKYCRHFSSKQICMAPTPAWAIILLSEHGENRASEDPQNEWQAQYCDVYSGVDTVIAGDRIEKKEGDYEAKGEVRAAFTKRDGTPRLVVEFDEPRGLLFIMRPDQVSPIGTS